MGSIELSATTATPAGVRESLGLPFSVDLYGAVGDGATDDTAAIQAAIDAAAAAGGGTVVLPDGVYAVNALVLKQAVTVSSLRHTRGNANTDVGAVRVVSNGSGWVVDTPATEIACCGWQGIDINGAGTAAGGLRLRDVHGGVFRDFTVHNTDGPGIQVQADSGANTIEDVVITAPQQAASLAANGGALEVAGVDNFFSRIEANCGLSALSSASMFYNGIFVSGTNNFFSHCIGEISDRGILVTGSTNRFSGCRADLNWSHGVDVSSAGGSNSFAACHAITNGRQTANTYSGFRVEGQANAFVGCAVSQSSGTVKYAFEDKVINGVPSNRTSWAGCTAANGSFGTGMFKSEGFLGSAPQIPAAPLAVADATTTPDVSHTSFLLLDGYTTATTITNFTGGNGGQRVYLLGDANVTIAHNSTIKTSTGANKTLADARAYCFIHYNGVWYEVGP